MRTERKPHAHVGIGYCPVCQHYGQDCEGTMTLKDSEFLEFISTDDAMRNPYATGYGNKIPSRFRVRLSDDRIRRVYIIQFSNAGTAYVIRDGKRVVIPGHRFP